jgi:uncharacterized protein YecT (DUF1311 family)
MSSIARLVLLSLALGLGLASSANAQYYNADTSPCKEAAVTSDLVHCLKGAYERADLDLNKTYKKIGKVLAQEDQFKLTKVQRLWISYRDATCAAERDLFGGGTAIGPAYWSCMEAETRIRVSSLKTAYGWRVEKFAN